MSIVDAADLSNVDIVGRLAVSRAVGGALGLERELKGHEAGIRTDALLALGAGMFGVVSVGAVSSFVGRPLMDDRGATPQVSVTSRRDERGAVDVDISDVRPPARKRLMIELSALPTVDEVGLVGD